MESGPDAAGVVSFPISLTPEQRGLYQDVAQIDRLLESARTIAVVGLSTDSRKDSARVALYLKKAGYRIVPVNPHAEEILGEKAYPDLASVPCPIDLVAIFRPPREIDALVDQAIARKAAALDAPAIWMQLRLINLGAAERAWAAGLTVIIDRCVMIEHGRLK